ncbi:hypothetical protein D8M06_19020 [Oceanobacillus halophilus]|uniref:Uncharacterized protein n=1 Tax=Oceanobacillus halophilus TaxID=930130 RepID=A0A494ZTN1_9BACI|nr:hypothetical protein D8M06_19020 [Oceanobacillus halophilus]
MCSLLFSLLEQNPLLIEGGLYERYTASIQLERKNASNLFLKLDLRQFHFVEPELYLNCKEEEIKQIKL